MVFDFLDISDRCQLTLSMSGMSYVSVLICQKYLLPTTYVGSETLSPPLHKRINHPLLARLVEIHCQLVRIHARDISVAEFLVEDSFAFFEAQPYGADDFAFAFGEAWVSCAWFRRVVGGLAARCQPGVA